MVANLEAALSDHLVMSHGNPGFDSRRQNQRSPAFSFLGKQRDVANRRGFVVRSMIPKVLIQAKPFWVSSNLDSDPSPLEALEGCPET